MGNEEGKFQTLLCFWVVNQTDHIRFPLVVSSIKAVLRNVILKSVFLPFDLIFPHLMTSATEEVGF